MTVEKLGNTTTEDFDLGGLTQESCKLAIVWLNPEGERRITRLTGRIGVVIGREEDCDVALPCRRISRQHAKLTRHDDAWVIRDTNSRNGVQLNGSPIARAKLEAGDVIRLGTWVGTVLMLSSGQEPTFGTLDDGLFGGPELRRAVDRVRVAAKSELSVVFEGETGTGKELFARSIHRRSERKGAFVAINCAMYQPATAVAELFGHRKGAFTGAADAHGGLVRAAEGGTLFLDEIADLSLDVQAQLLRVLENRELIPLGETRPIRINVRFVAATNRPLSQAVQEGRFRADLRARLEGFRIVLPPLRDRHGDVPFLLHHLLAQQSQHPPMPDERVLERLCLYDWPLNVRELVGLTRRIAAAHPQGKSVLTLEQVVELLPELGRATALSEAGALEGKPRGRVDPRAFCPDQIAALRSALERHSGSVAKAAADLAITRQRAYRMLKSPAP